MASRSLSGLALIGVVATLSACTVARVGAEDGPSRIESNGLIDGHAALGIRADDTVFQLDVLDGDSDGAVGKIVLWKLFRLEIGLLGVDVGVGPLDVGLGVAFYDPEVPAFQHAGDEQAPPAPPPAPRPPERCVLCEAAAARGHH